MLGSLEGQNFCLGVLTPFPPNCGPASTGNLQMLWARHFWTLEEPPFAEFYSIKSPLQKASSKEPFAKWGVSSLRSSL